MGTALPNSEDQDKIARSYPLQFFLKVCNVSFLYNYFNIILLLFTCMYYVMRQVCPLRSFSTMSMILAYNLDIFSSHDVASVSDKASP